ncbi:signal peptidase 22kDa subunit [Cokeromyces recurvatus]|uniref:signal peptidase 22kDa subunit n=1 Tax=Cokeromyces recurvatus TaxID=90255 RepID=UPI00221E6153|nr:signal peptidase 22kDa subunit [Cokeromyces recurvatus]KAI7906725.1 signal peptidase 22kDa subunit [Cokeromyces recurvatus]
MYNLQQRANNLFSLALSVLGTVLAVVAIISAITGYGTIEDELRVDSKNIRVVTRRYGPENTDYRNSKSEFARFQFDVDADFTPLFNWNTKQIFVTVVAEYETKNFKRNQVVIWDKIITSKDKAHVKLRNIRNKYAMIDISQKWNFERANLTLLWDVTPYVGILQSGHSNKGSQFILPAFASQMK